MMYSEFANQHHNEIFQMEVHDKTYLYSIVPIILKIHNESSDEDEEFHFMNLCMVFKRDKFLESIRSKGKYDDQIFTMILLGFSLIMIMLFTTGITFRLAHCIFRPLR